MKGIMKRYLDKKNINFQIDETIDGLKRWFHVLPYGEISYDGEVWNVDTKTMDEIYLNLKKYLSVGGSPVVLAGFHSYDNEDKTLSGVGFVVDAEVIYEKTEDKASGLWVQIEIKNQSIGERVTTGELKGCSGGFFMGTLELAKTGEVLEGWMLDHLTLTNSPRITWLDSNRPELAEKKVMRQFLDFIQNLFTPPMKESVETLDITKPATGGNMAEKELLMAEQAKTIELTEKLKAKELENSELSAKIKAFEEAEQKAKDVAYENRIKELVTKNIIPAAKGEEFLKNRLDLQTLNAIFDFLPAKEDLTASKSTREKGDVELSEKLKAAHGVKREV